MSLPRTRLGSREWDRIHREKRIRKLERIHVLRDLQEMWEAREDVDHAYLLRLRARLRSAENQYAAMQP
jgi:hypothetical protein